MKPRPFEYPRLGLCMEGNEASFWAWLRSVVETRDQGVYLEIGVACGDTFSAVASYLQHHDYGTKEWCAVGLDICGGWSLDTHQILHKFPDDRIIVTRSRVWLGQPGWGQVTLMRPPENEIEAFNRFDFAKAGGFSCRQYPLGFVLIDGCHGYSCCKADFEWVAPMVMGGGVVCFHDATAGCQGQHMQPHCQTGIDVRRAIQDLGLLPGKAPARPGWIFLEEVATAPHGCVFVQRINPVLRPSEEQLSKPQ